LESWSDNRKSKIQNRKWAGLFATVIALTACGAMVEAQQPGKLYRIGYLTGNPRGANSERIDAFRQGLRELGYFEGKNIVIHWRSADGKLERLPGLASELVRLNVDVLVTGGPSATRPAKEVTSTVPIVMTQDSDPVGNGFITSLARPGGNITGLSTVASEMSGKQVELLKEIVPKLSRVVVLGTSTNPGNAQALRDAELGAGAFGVKFQYLDVRATGDIEPMFQEASKLRADGILVVNSIVFNSQRKQVAHLAVKSRLPTLYSRREFVDTGGLISYGVSISDLDRRAAIYVDKILKGAKPGDLPVEQPTKFELMINLKAAKQIGLTIPPNVLARADRVIR
jgi:putative ABC transport system substrate-binding protein